MRAILVPSSWVVMNISDHPSSSQSEYSHVDGKTRVKSLEVHGLTKVKSGNSKTAEWLTEKGVSEVRGKAVLESRHRTPSTGAKEERKIFMEHLLWASLWSS